MEKLTDLKICELIGTSPQNLRATYKKSPNPKKRFMYQALKAGILALQRGEGTDYLCPNCGTTMDLHICEKEENS